MFEEAVPLLALSLSHSPSHQDALIDHVVALARSGENVAAESALEALRGQVADGKSVSRIEEVEREMADMK